MSLECMCAFSLSMVTSPRPLGHVIAKMVTKRPELERQPLLNALLWLQ